MILTMEYFLLIFFVGRGEGVEEFTIIYYHRGFLFSGAPGFLFRARVQPWGLDLFHFKNRRYKVIEKTSMTQKQNNFVFNSDILAIGMNGNE